MRKNKIREKSKQIFYMNTDGGGLQQNLYINLSTGKLRIAQSHVRTSDNGMSGNKSCNSYLGIYIAEKILSKVFKDVKRMPNNNRGYDFICGKGYKIDVKSRCRYYPKNRNSYYWDFHLYKNQIADYFLCLAFDNREDLNPEYLWLIPGKEINDKNKILMVPSTMIKWDKYRLDIEKVENCCDFVR